MVFRNLFFTLTLSLIHFSSAQNVTTTLVAKNESLPAVIVASATTVTSVHPSTTTTTTTKPKSLTTIKSTLVIANATNSKGVGNGAENVTTSEEKNNDSGLGSFFSILSPFVPAQEIGSNCTTQSNCKLNGSTCLEGKCSCSEEFVVNWNNRECLLKATALGDDCIEDSQCKISLEKTVGSVMCLSQKCVCGPDAKYFEMESQAGGKKGICVQSHSSLGVNCEADASCTVPNSVCTQNLCACKSGMLPSPENDRCVPAAKKLGGSCSDDAQCQEYLGDFSLCEEGSCNCKPNHHADFNFTQCLPDKELGEACSRPEECMIHTDRQAGSSRDCVNSVCVCLSVSCREQAGLKSTSSAATNYFQIPLIIVLIFSCFS